MILTEKNLKKLSETPTFIRVKDWILLLEVKTSERKTLQLNLSKTSEFTSSP